MSYGGRGGLFGTRSSTELDKIKYSEQPQEPIQEWFPADHTIQGKAPAPEARLPAGLDSTIESIQRNVGKAIQKIESLSNQVSELSGLTQESMEHTLSEEQAEEELEKEFLAKLAELDQCHKDIVSVHGEIQARIAEYQGLMQEQASVYDVLTPLFEQLRENTQAETATQAEIAKATGKINKLESALPAATLKISNTSEDIARSCASILSTVYTLTQKSQEIQKIHENLLPLFRSFEVAREVLSKYQDQVTTYLTEITGTHKSLNAQCSSLFTRVEKESTNIKSLLDLIGICKNEISCSYTAIGSSIEEMQSLKRSIDAALSILNSTVKSINGALTNTDKSITKLTQTVSTMWDRMSVIPNKMYLNVVNHTLEEMKKIHANDIASLKKDLKTNKRISTTILVMLLIVIVVLSFCLVYMTLHP